MSPASAFDSLETKFFKEGDDLSVAGTESPSGSPSVAQPQCGWDEVTIVCARRRRKGRFVSCVALVVIGFAACAVLACWHARCGAVAASLPEPDSAAASVSVSPAPPLPAPVAATPDEPEASPPRAAAGAFPTETKSTASDGCRNAFAKRLGREVLAECRRAFAEDPQSAEIAVMLAKTEFVRGRFRPARDWARKALALDESQADAYVYLGGAEQATGHAAAARTAYQRYLQLSPKGRYASDLRKVLASL